MTINPYFAGGPTVSEKFGENQDIQKPAHFHSGKIPEQNLYGNFTRGNEKEVVSSGNGFDEQFENKLLQQEFEKEYMDIISLYLGEDNGDALSFINILYLQNGGNIVDAIIGGLQDVENGEEIGKNILNHLGIEEGEGNPLDQEWDVNSYVLGGLAEDIGEPDFKKVEKRLTNNEERKKNREQAEMYFYNPEYIDGLLKSMKLEPKEYNKKIDFFKREDVQESLQNIMGNFVTNIEGTSLKDVFENQGEEASLTIQRALDYAFEWETGNMLKGKHNYSETKVDTLLIEIRGGNPFEKLEKFMELKELISTGEGRGGKKQSELFKSKKEIEKMTDGEKKEFFQSLKNSFTQAKKEQNIEKITSILEQAEALKESIKKEDGDVFPAGKLDIFIGEIESAIKENAD